MAEQIDIARDMVTITVPEDIAQVRQEWVKQKKEEFGKATIALQNAAESGLSERQVKRLRERVSLLKKVVRALESGYVPIPRFDSEKLNLDMEEVPLKAIVSINEAVTQHLFNEFRIVHGREATNRNRGPYSRITKRDPIIVGVVRTPEVVLSTWDGGRPRDTWSDEEHFLIAWWRPENTGPEDLF